MFKLIDLCYLLRIFFARLELIFYNIMTIFLENNRSPILNHENVINLTSKLTDH